MNWLRAFAPSRDAQEKYYALIEAINNLRNKVAHKFEGPERDKALRNLRVRLNPFLSDDECVSDKNDWRDYNVVATASMLSIAFLVGLRKQLQDGK